MTEEQMDQWALGIFVNGPMDNRLFVLEACAEERAAGVHAAQSYGDALARGLVTTPEWIVADPKTGPYGEYRTVSLLAKLTDDGERLLARVQSLRAEQRLSRPSDESPIEQGVPK